MDNPRHLRGIELRYALTMHFGPARSATVTSLVASLAAHGFDTGGRPSKSVSDAWRWEIAHGRRRLGRGLYGPAGMPRATEYRIHKHVPALRAEAANLSLTRRWAQRPFTDVH